MKASKVGFLLGAGSSYLNGEGYPLAFDLWEYIKDRVPADQRADIQSKLDSENIGIEKALDLLDVGKHNEGPHRHSVVRAIGEYFSELNPDLAVHRRFVQALSYSAERKVLVFSLNYDPLIERSAEIECIRLVDGFTGHDRAFFDQSVFTHDIAIIQSSYQGGLRRAIPTWIKLVKLHGSLGWYDDPEFGLRRGAFNAPVNAPAQRLMIPPQHRKATDTVTAPYARLWTEFRGSLIHGPDYINRLVCIGYGMADEHVSNVIEAALTRTNFTLIIATKALHDQDFERWSKYKNAIVVTKDRSSHYGTIGEGHEALSTFEGIVEELMK
ncbi:MAG: SIR2 family protein [Rhodospirillales bacterium]|nr:SIR2 family protein [Rhodospirillales bacterium]